MTILTSGSQASTLEAEWQLAPTLGLLRRGAAQARHWPVEVQRTWSQRVRDAGLWHLCPLVAVAQDRGAPPAERAEAAAAAWDLDRDRRGRAVLAKLVPGLDDRGLGRARSQMSPAAERDLESLPVVWSASPFFNELDILHARLAELSRVVDHFVVVEANQTHRGEPKPLYLDADIERFRPWEAQFERLVVDLPDTDDAWRRERYQRDVAGEFMARLGARPMDLVLLTDIDEIVRADAVPRIVEATATSPVMLAMTMYWYSLDWADRPAWLHPKAFRFGQLEPGPAYSDLRMFSPLPVVDNAGWHVSWFGDEDRFDTKISSYAHSEADTDENHDRAYQSHLITDGVNTMGEQLLHRRDYFPATMAALFPGGHR